MEMTVIGDSLPGAVAHMHNAILSLFNNVTLLYTVSLSSCMIYKMESALLAKLVILEKAIIVHQMNQMSHQYASIVS